MATTNHAPATRSLALNRNFWLAAVCLVTLAAFWPSLKLVFALALHDDRYLQILIAPAIGAALLFWRRNEIFSEPEYSPRSGLPLLSFAILLGIFAVYLQPGGQTAALPLAVFATALAWAAAFLLCRGARSFRAARYPLSCLLLMVPLPAAWMDRVVHVLQNWSAAVSYDLLRFSGIPVFRHGMVFSLPGLEFEVAPECSGIRSGLALLMVALIAGYVYLGSGWSRTALIVLTIPIVVFKNAVRIAALSTLAAYVNRAFLTGPIHHRYGGLLFSVVGVILFVLVLTALQRLERWRRDRRKR